VPAEALAKEGNGRTARLLMNLLLLQHGYPIAIIKKEKRAEYIAAIEYARQNEDFTKFYTVIIEAAEYVLDAYLQAVKESGLL
jgi:Fic family protein